MRMPYSPALTVPPHLRWRHRNTTTMTGNILRALNRGGIILRKLERKDPLTPGVFLAAGFRVGFGKSKMGFKVIGSSRSASCKCSMAPFRSPVSMRDFPSTSCAEGSFGASPTAFCAWGSASLARFRNNRTHAAITSASAFDGASFNSCRNSVEGRVGVGGKQQVTIKKMCVGCAGINPKQLLKCLRGRRLISSQEPVGSVSGCRNQRLLLCGDVLWQQGHSQSSQSDRDQQFWVGDTVLGEKGIRLQAHPRNSLSAFQQRFMIAKDLFIAWLVRSAEGYSVLDVPQGFGVLPGFEFAQTAQRDGGASAGNHLDIVRKSIPRLAVGSCSVLQRTQEPPSIRPFWVGLHGSGIEFNRARNVVLRSRRGGLRNQIAFRSALAGRQGTTDLSRKQRSEQPKHAFSAN